MTNNSVANLDYELAQQFMNADFKFVERDLDENGQYKYRTYSSFFNDENKPLSLFEKETSQMSLTIVDAEKVIPVETSDLFFDLVKNLISFNESLST